MKQQQDSKAEGKNVPSKSKKYPVPSWMDESLKPIAQKLSGLERHNLAEKLERQASQLRELNAPKIEHVVTVPIKLRPKAKEALLMFAQVHGASEYSEDDQLKCGALWFFEIALAKVREISQATCNFAYYRDSEGLDNSIYSEKLIGDALEKWKAECAQEDEADDDNED